MRGYFPDVAKPSMAMMTMNVSNVELAIFSNICTGLKKANASMIKNSVQYMAVRVMAYFMNIAGPRVRIDGSGLESVSCRGM